MELQFLVLRKGEYISGAADFGAEAWSSGHGFHI